MSKIEKRFLDFEIYEQSEVDNLLTTLSGNLSQDYVKVSDVKAYDVGGGTFTQDAWQTRDFNTEDSDDSNICSISSNQITLAAGVYTCHIYVPAYRVDQHIARLYNVSDSSETLLGSSASSNDRNLVFNYSHIVGKFTITVEKIFEVQHQCIDTYATSGFGISHDISGVNNVYTVAEFWRTST